MSASTRSLEDGSPPQGDAKTTDPAAQTTEPESPTESSLSVSVAGDHCATCGAALAQDQRYCVECGTRRGAPRFSALIPTQSASASAPATTRRSAGRPSAMLVVAVIATLLIAFGVGVLIGHDTSSKAPTVTVLNGSGASSSGSGATSGNSSSHSGSSGSSGNSSSHSGSGGSGSSSGSSGSGSSPSPSSYFH